MVVDMLFPSNTFLFLHYAQQQRESRGVKVGINYTLVPTEPFPVQLLQAGRILALQPIAGDSAGGNLVLATLTHTSSIG